MEMEGKSMDVDVQDVMDSPTSPQLPQTNEYTPPQFYIRKCYDVYYDQAKQLLNTYKYVSITGTKGIFLLI
jgi:hypothetical protein